MASKLFGASNPSYKHGHATKQAKYSTEYNSWCNMRRRCYSESNNRYYTYGALGITVCDRWNPLKGGSFENFLEDMGECPENCSLDRENLKGNYEPSNCKWATDIEQANNKSNSRLLVDADGTAWSLRRWCMILGKDYKACWYRIFKKKEDPEVVLGEGFKHKEKI